MHRCSKVTKILRIHFNGLGGQREAVHNRPKIDPSIPKGGGVGGWGRKGASNIAQSNQERGSCPAAVIS